MSQSENQIQGDGGDTQPSTQPSTCETTREDGSTTKNNGGKPRSKIWDHFTKYDTPEGRKKCKCNYCETEYFCDSKTNGTSSLWAHLSSCRKNPATVCIKQSQLNLQPIKEGGDENMGSLTPWKFDQELCRKKLNEMIIKDELPFRLVEGEGFREFVSTLQPRFKIPSRWTISRDCYQLFLAEKERLRDLFIETGQSVSITTDTWTSLQSVLSSVHELYDVYKTLYASPNSGATTQASIQTESSLTSFAKNRVMANKYKKQKINERSVSSIDELDVYCKEAVVSSEDEFDILSWWKMSQHRFPILSLFARDILAVPISTVASESAFSTGGRVLDPFRSSLTPKIVECLICTQDWLRRSKELISIEEDLDALMKHEEGLNGLTLNDVNEVVQAKTTNRSNNTSPATTDT